MALPTLLVPGTLRGDLATTNREDTPARIITRWVKHHVGELQAAPPRTLADRVLIVKAETGSGKSTVLPVEIFRVFRPADVAPRVPYRGRSVICTQPRILTAKSLVREVADRGYNPDMVRGRTVGFQTGPVNERPVKGLIYSTIGVLLAQMRLFTDAEIIDEYSVIIVDEAHERSLDADTAMMRLKHLLERNMGNPRLPVVILASATIDIPRYAAYFGVGSANVADVEGRAHLVDIVYPAHGTNDYTAAAAELVLRLHREGANDPPGKGDILVFLPGGREIDAVARILRAASVSLAAGGEPAFLVLHIDRDAVRFENSDYRLLHADPATLRAPGGGARRPVPASRRVILSTVVAETGVTIETLKYVVDSGWYRSAVEYPPWSIGGIITLPAPSSRVQQRIGRTGREFPGMFYPLYTRNVHKSLPADQLPEIITQGVDSAILDIIATRTARAQVPFRISEIDMLDPPPVDALARALERAAYAGFVRVVPGDPGGLVLTPAGHIASRFTRLDLGNIALLMGGGLWGVSLLDLATIAALSRPMTPLVIPLNAPGHAEGDACLVKGLPGFLREGRRDTGLVPLAARLLISDDFVEGFFEFEGFARALEEAEGDPRRIGVWCAESGVSLPVAVEIAQARDEIINEALQAGLDPFIIGGRRLNDPAVTPRKFAEIVLGVKRCIYGAHRGNVLCLDSSGIGYTTRRGLKVAVHPRFSGDKAAARLSNLGAPSFRPARYLVAEHISIRLARSRQDPPPFVYDLSAGRVSVLDGFIAPDLEFGGPRDPC